MKKIYLLLFLSFIASAFHFKAFAQPVGGPGRLVVPGTHISFTDSSGSSAGVTSSFAAAWVSGNGWRLQDNIDAIRTPTFDLEHLRSGNLKWYVRIYNPSTTTTYVTFVEWYGTSPDIDDHENTFYQSNGVSTYSDTLNEPMSFSAFSLDISKSWFPLDAIEPDFIQLYIQEFWIEADASVLPISLTAFNVTKNDNEVSLKWETVSEQNNNGFEIERSTDGRSWNKVAFVSSLGITGNSSAKLSYSYKDVSPINGISYYRLKQVDFDGKFSYSPVRSIRFTGMPGVNIYPNPSNGAFFIDGLKGGEKVVVSNVLGHTIKNISMASPSTGKKILIDNLASGIYYVSIRDMQGNSKTTKIIKR